MSDYYDILNIKSNASQSEIKSAYKRLALLHHPDRNGGRKESEESFKQVYEAYKILSNVSKRRMYDRNNHIYANPNIKYSYHAGGFYKSVFDKGIVQKAPLYHKPEVFRSKKKDVDFYLFWAAIAFISILIIFLVVKI